MPSSVLSQISAILTTVTEVVLETATNDPEPATVTDGGVPLATNAAGDIDIYDDSDLALSAVNSYISKATCSPTPSSNPATRKSLNKKDASVIDCLLTTGQNVVGQIGVSDTLVTLQNSLIQVPANFPIPEFANVDYGAALAEFSIIFWNTIPETLPSLPDTQVTAATIFTFSDAIAGFQQSYATAFFSRRTTQLIKRSLLLIDSTSRNVSLR